MDQQCAGNGYDQGDGSTRSDEGPDPDHQMSQERFLVAAAPVLYYVP